MCTYKSLHGARAAHDTKHNMTVQSISQSHSVVNVILTFADSHHDVVRSDQPECFGDAPVPVRTQHVPHILPPAEEHAAKVNPVNELRQGHRQNEQH